MSLALPLNQKIGQETTCYLGIDPGLRRTGYAIIERRPGGPILREGGVIRSDDSATLGQRVLEIGSGLEEVIQQFQPQVASIEQIFSLGKNPRSSLLMAHARGAILLTLAAGKIPVVHYTPTQVKKILTGSGKASKEQIQHAIKNEFRLKDLLEPNDVADAAAIALCLYHSVKITL